MKKSIIAVSALALGLAGASAFADIKIGVVNMQQVLTTAPQMKKINASLKKQFSGRRAVILKQAKSLQGDVSNYTKNKAVLSPSKSAALKSKIASEESQLRTEQIQYQQAVSAAQNRAMTGFLNRLKLKVATIAKQNKLQVVFPQDALLYAGTNTDITGQVLKTLK